MERLLRGIISPIEELSNTTKAITRGDRVHFTEEYPPNEIGLLALSFQEMVKKINEKEEELIDQNEELLCQQEELQSQQEKLKSYLMEIENINKALDQSSILCITDSNGIILSINEMFAQVTQYKKEELNGLMKQLSVALSRINMYEEVENTKNLNENIIENVNEGLQLVSLQGQMLQYN